jgi:hypothetical protein
MPLIKTESLENFLLIWKKRSRKQIKKDSPPRFLEDFRR